MSRRSDPVTLLAPAPTDVRARMLAADRLEPGAAAVVGRFFDILAQRGEPIAAPSRAAFDAAAASEPTLATLLRALAAHAPQVCLAGGREARKAWYARRPRKGPARRRGPAPLAATAPAHWPLEWALLYPALLRAPIRDTSRRRYVASISRCAAVLPRTDAAPDWSRYMSYCLLEALEEQGIRPRTIAGYLDGLIALGLHGGIGEALAGLHEMRNAAMSRAKRMEKLKIGRIADLTERGGFPLIAEAVGRLRAEADALPGSSAAAERMRCMAAVLAVELNAYGRTGDVAGWRLGVDLVREPWGAWRLAWDQGKTGIGQDLGELWPEIGEILDEMILAGRPRRYAALRYSELAGANWLTHADQPPAARYPSQLVHDAIGVPLHDLRTVLADFLRQVDPARARGLIAAMLGHASEHAGEEYRAACEGDAAARDWQEMRHSIATKGLAA